MQYAHKTHRQRCMLQSCDVHFTLPVQVVCGLSYKVELCVKSTASDTSVSLYDTCRHFMFQACFVCRQKQVQCWKICGVHCLHLDDSICMKVQRKGAVPASAAEALSCYLQIRLLLSLMMMMMQATAYARQWPPAATVGSQHVKSKRSDGKGSTDAAVFYCSLV